MVKMGDPALKLVEREEPARLEGILNSDRYNPRKLLGRGTWGAVYECEDSLTGDNVAVKVLEPTDEARKQMEHRRLDVNKVMMHEAVKLSACPGIVPRVYDVDKDGKPHIVMPVYERFLSDKLFDDSHRERVGYGLSLERVLFWLKNISSGVSQIHSKLRRAHGDIKPDNIAIDEDGRLLLNDLGSSTCASLGRSESPRDNIGFLHTRAPECYQENGHPTKQSDVWSVGALGYRFFTGKYPLEKELGNAVDPCQLDLDALDLIIKKKIKQNIPRHFRKFFRKCLAIDTVSRKGRFYEGNHVLGSLEKTIERLNNWKTLRKSARIGWPLIAITGFISLASYGAYVHEQEELTLPKPEMRGILYPAPPREDEIVEFEVEEIPYEKRRPFSGFIGGQDRMAKLVTDNRIVAYLAKTHGEAKERTQGFSGPPIYTDHQYKVFMAYTSNDERKFMQTRCGPVWPIWAKSIEVALSESKTKDGKVDLEDVMAISRLGTSVVSHAKRTVGSEDYEVYKGAKDNNELIIPEDEQKFIQEWLNYFHSGG